jgi:hypothetical protein
VLLADIVNRSLLSLCGDAGANDTVFASRMGGVLTERAVHGMVKRAAAKADTPAVDSPRIGCCATCTDRMRLTAAPLWVAVTLAPAILVVHRAPPIRRAYRKVVRLGVNLIAIAVAAT